MGGGGEKVGMGRYIFVARTKLNEYNQSCAMNSETLTKKTSLNVPAYSPMAIAGHFIRAKTV